MNDALHTIGGGPPLDERALCAFEREHAIRLPPPYRGFLARTNGGRPTRDLFDAMVAHERRSMRVLFFFGLETVVASCHLGWYRTLLGDRLPADMLAIATTDAADKVCISLVAGRVALWDGRTACTVASSFEDFEHVLYRDGRSPKANGSIWAIRGPR